MRAASQVVKTKPAAREARDKPICHQTGLKGINAHITTGEVNGMMEPQKPKLLSGLLSTLMAIMMEIMIGAVTGIIKDCWSLSSPIAAPMAANMEPYNKKPPRK